MALQFISLAATALLIVLLAILLLAYYSVKSYRTGDEEYLKTGKRPKGYYMGIGIAMGLPLGLPLAIATENPGMMGAGLAVGLAIGAALEEKNKDKLRPLTAEEQKNRHLAIRIGIGLLVLGAIAALAVTLIYAA